MLASKGVGTEKMWKDVARSFDNILRWRGLLHHTGYLMEHQNKNLSYVYGEPLSPDIINISENAKIKT